VKSFRVSFCITQETWKLSSAPRPLSGPFDVSIQPCRLPLWSKLPLMMLWSEVAFGANAALRCVEPS
jgi:hypothetical protein